MVHKKKYIGFLKLLLLPLFIMLLGMCSICYATVRTTLTDDEATYLFNNSFTNTYFDKITPTTNTNYQPVINLYNYNHINTFKTLFNQYNIIDLQYKNVVFFPIFWSNSDGWFVVVNANSGKVDTLPHLYLEFGSETFNSVFNKYCRTIKFNFIDDNGNLLNDINIYKADFHIDQNSFTLGSFETKTFNTFNSLWTLYYYYDSPYNLSNDNNRLLLNPLNHITTFVNTNTIYTNWDGFTLTNTPIQHLLKTNYSYAPPINPPVPDDTGETGQITDNNGDVTGNIDLSGIQNSLGNIDNTTTQIEQNTQTIIEQQQQINNNLTTQPDLSQTEITQEQIEDAIDFDFISDPYANFWWDFIDGVELALLGSVRQLPVNWLGYNGYFNLDGLINYPTSLKNILTTVSTVCVVWIMLKWWKVIIDKLTSGDIDEVLEIVEEQGRVNITNLF